MLDPTDFAEMQELRHADNAAKVEFIADLVVALKWSPRSRKQCSEGWQMAPKTVKQLADIAMQTITASVAQNPEKLIQALVEQSYTVARAALHKKKFMVDKTGAIQGVPDPDPKTAIAALGLVAKVSGVEKYEPPNDRKQYERMDLKDLASQLLEEADSKKLPQAAQITTGEEDNETTEIVESAVSGNASREHDGA